MKTIGYEASKIPAGKFMVSYTTITDGDQVISIYKYDDTPWIMGADISGTTRSGGPQGTD